MSGSDDIRQDQLRSDKVKWDWVRSYGIRFDPMISNEMRLDKMGLDSIRWNQMRSVEIKWDLIGLDQMRSDLIHKMGSVDLNQPPTTINFNLPLSTFINLSHHMETSVNVIKLDTSSVNHNQYFPTSTFIIILDQLLSPSINLFGYWHIICHLPSINFRLLLSYEGNQMTDDSWLMNDDCRKQTWWLLNNEKWIMTDDRQNMMDDRKQTTAASRLMKIGNWLKMTDI